MKQILFVLTIVLCLGLVSASQITSLGEKQQGKSVNLIQNCVNSTYANITRVTYPNGSFALNTQTAMTKNGDDYDYTFSNTKELGPYYVYGQCDEDGIKTNWVYDFTITTTGRDNGNTLPLFLLLGAFIIFGFASYLKNEYIGLFSGMLFIVAGIYMMIYGLGSFADDYTRAISFITLGIGLSVCFIAIVEMFYTDLGIMGGGSDD